MPPRVRAARSAAGAARPRAAPRRSSARSRLRRKVDRHTRRWQGTAGVRATRPPLGGASHCWQPARRRDVRANGRERYALARDDSLLSNSRARGTDPRWHTHAPAAAGRRESARARRTAATRGAMMGAGVHGCRCARAARRRAAPPPRGRRAARARARGGPVALGRPAGCCDGARPPPPRAARPRPAPPAVEPLMHGGSASACVARALGSCRRRVPAAARTRDTREHTPSTGEPRAGPEEH